VYQAALSPNLLEQPRLEKHLQQLLSDVDKMRGLIVPASKETRIQKSTWHNAVHGVAKTQTQLSDLTELN